MVKGLDSFRDKQLGLNESMEEILDVFENIYLQ